MLLFSRALTLTGGPRRALPWALGVTSYVNDHSDLDVTLWSGTFGYPVGTLAWSALVGSQAALAASTAALVVDDGYLDLLEQAQDLISEPPEDLLGQLIHGEPGDPPRRPGLPASPRGDEGPLHPRLRPRRPGDAPRLTAAGAGHRPKCGASVPGVVGWRRSSCRKPVGG
jgi:hypothetical protein